MWDAIKDYANYGATALARLVEQREVSPDELLDDTLAQVKAINPKINAVVLIQEEVARRKIREVLIEGPFCGVPFVIKNLGAEAVDFPSHNGSRRQCQGNFLAGGVRAD